MFAHIEDFMKKHWRVLIVYIVAVVGIIVVTLLLYFYSKPDKEGLLSLAFTIGLVITLPLIMGKSLEDVPELKTRLKKRGVRYAFIALILIGASVVSLWLSVRKIGLLVKLYLFEKKYLYTHYEIFEILSYILATRLCFTLFDTVTMKMDKPARKKMLDAVIQAILIGIITLLPKYDDTRLLGIIGDTRERAVFSFVLILLSMGIMLVLLTLVRERIKE